MDYLNNYLSLIANLISIGGFIFTIHKSAKNGITGKALINFSNHILSLICFSFTIIMAISFIYDLIYENESTIKLIFILISYILHIYFTCVLLYEFKKDRLVFFLFLSIVILTVITAITFLVMIFTDGMGGITLGVILALLIVFPMCDVLFCITVFRNEKY